MYIAAVGILFEFSHIMQICFASAFFVYSVWILCEFIVCNSCLCYMEIVFFDNIYRDCIIAYHMVKYFGI